MPIFAHYDTNTLPYYVFVFVYAQAKQWGEELQLLQNNSIDLLLDQISFLPVGKAW